jgi:hypothetical protein
MILAPPVEDFLFLIRQVYITSDKDITISVGLILDSDVATTGAIPITNRTPALLTYGGSPQTPAVQTDFGPAATPIQFMQPSPKDFQDFGFGLLPNGANGQAFATPDVTRGLLDPSVYLTFARCYVPRCRSSKLLPLPALRPLYQNNSRTTRIMTATQATKQLLDMGCVFLSIVDIEGSTIIPKQQNKFTTPADIKKQADKINTYLKTAPNGTYVIEGRIGGTSKATQIVIDKGEPAPAIAVNNSAPSRGISDHNSRFCVKLPRCAGYAEPDRYPY